MPASTSGGAATQEVSAAPERQGLVLAALILVAAVANLPLASANVALPSIGLHFDASQTQLNLVAVCYSLGLAVSVLWFGAVGDRYGRKQMMLVGVVVSLPAVLLMAWAPNIQTLIGARFVGGLAAGMAYPTTLSLITALWSGPSRTRGIALWSAIGGGVSALGPLLAGLFLRALVVGVCIPDHGPAHRDRGPLGLQGGAEPCQRDGRTCRPRRRDPLAGPRRHAHPRHQLRGGARQDDIGRQPGHHRRRRTHRVRAARAPGARAAL